ncbi:MAG: hypothetical protein AB4080_03035 [Trichodesmium sp.]
MKDKLLNWLDTFLVVDVFLVIIGFAWFAVAVIGRYSGVSLGLDLWHRLWEPVFTPAIGILMGGAILSGIIKQITKRLGSRD